MDVSGQRCFDMPKKLLPQEFLFNYFSLIIHVGFGNRVKELLKKLRMKKLFWKKIFWWGSTPTPERGLTSLILAPSVPCPRLVWGLTRYYNGYIFIIGQNTFLIYPVKSRFREFGPSKKRSYLAGR